MTLPARQFDNRAARRNTGDHYREVYDRTNDYQETVQALIAFAALVCHDGRTRRNESQFGFGRRMRTSAANPVASATDVTPDCVAQMNPRYGIVAEVKKQLSRDPAQWSPHLEQLRKYDDNLVGWWTPQEDIDTSDAVLLVHQSRSRAFVRFLEEQRESNSGAVGPHSSVIEFNRADEGQPYLFFRTEWGQVRDAAIAQKLTDGASVPVAKVLKSFPSVKFYDAKPPLEDLMKTLWIDLLASFDRKSPEGGIPVVVSELTREMQRAYGSQALHQDERASEFPKVSWIREALDAFARLGLATTSGDGERYTVNYKVFPKQEDLLERFCRLTSQETRSDISSDQLTFFVQP